MSCPLACPLAWSPTGANTCGRGRYGAVVPANDCTSVSARMLAGAPVLSGVEADVSCSSDAASMAQRGVVVCCPLACPLASSTPLFSFFMLLPAKEWRKRRADAVGYATGGGRS